MGKWNPISKTDIVPALHYRYRLSGHDRSASFIRRTVEYQGGQCDISSQELYQICFSAFLDIVSVTISVSQRGNM